MTEQTQTQDEAGSRFPFINLKKTLARAKQLYDAAGDQDVLVSDAFVTWSYSQKSSGGHQTVAALIMYGIVRGFRAKDQRKLILTHKGLRYFRDEREEAIAELRRGFALSPRLIQALWDKWGSSPPADNIARSHLKIDRELSDQAARSLLGIYKENLVFADLKGSGKMRESGKNGGEDVLPSPPSPKPEAGLMEDERIIFTDEITPEHRIRVLASGPVDETFFSRWTTLPSGGALG